MDPNSVAALTALTTLLTGILPPAAIPAQAPILAVLPRRFGPTGLGSLIGLHSDPFGDLHGTRLQATVVVTVRGDTLSNLSASAADVSRAFLAADAAALRRQGVFYLRLSEMGSAPPVGGDGTLLEDRILFDVLFEHVQPPTESENVIDRVPIDVEVGRTGAPAVILASLAFETEPSLAEFDPIDDLAAGTDRPGDWRVNPAEGRIEQRSRIRGATNLSTRPNKPGTALVLRPSATGGLVRDFCLKTTLRTDVGGAGSDGIGLIFRWRDADNFYFFLMDRGGGYRMLAKKADGGFQALAEADAALDETQGYEAGRFYDLKVIAAGADLEVHLDGRRILRGRDATLVEPGRVGFLTRDNDRAQFYRLYLSTV